MSDVTFPGTRPTRTCLDRRSPACGVAHVPFCRALRRTTCSASRGHCRADRAANPDRSRARSEAAAPQPRAPAAADGCTPAEMPATPEPKRQRSGEPNASRRPNARPVEEACRRSGRRSIRVRRPTTRSATCATQLRGRKEKLVTVHEPEGVGCETCHGMSAQAQPGRRQPGAARRHFRVGQSGQFLRANATKNVTCSKATRPTRSSSPARPSRTRPAPVATT